MKEKLVKVLPYVGVIALGVTAYFVVTDPKVFVTSALAAGLVLAGDRILRKNNI